MRSNLPVTQQEYTFPADQTLVSVTDLKGRITYCNPSFIEVSGFSRDELLGQPHNIVRHPDMPEEAFRDLWQTIQSGLPWSGLVKNRRKNGDHYWVRANATPMMDGDTITGYLSVRTIPAREEIQAADGLYARLREEAQQGRLKHALQQGQVIRRDVWGRLLSVFKAETNGQLVLIQLLASALVMLPTIFDLPTVWFAASVTSAVLWAFWATRALAIKPLHALVADANRLASGDLSLAIETGASGLVGRLQQALMQLSVNLRTVVQDVRSEISQLANAAREIAAGNDNLSARTEAQASSLEQTASSMEEINGTIQQSSKSASRGAHLAQETLEISQRSNEAVLAVAQTMNEITGSSRRIEDIIQLVEGVAFQTNILALNAAVEAARAGDAGRGFAVVAAEVRALASRTAEAAREIQRLISESGERVVLGSKRTSDATGRMSEANEAVGKVKAVLAEISNAATEQSLGIGQINEAVTHLDSITQQNAALVEELAASAQSLESLVAGVNNSMRLFRLRSGEVSLSQMDAVSLRKQSKLLANA